ENSLSSSLKRYWNTSLYIFFMSDSATRQLRISPGGIVLTALRKDPLDPPSSATVTMAVTLQSAFFRPSNKIGRPVPPPITATFARLAGRGFLLITIGSSTLFFLCDHGG